jgi:hypothetical protein
MAVVVTGPLLALLAAAGKTSPAEAWSWLASSDHGVPYPHSWRTPLVVLWGAVRSLVHAPYPYEAPIWRVALQTALGSAAWLVLLLLRRRSASTPRPAGDLTFLVVWSVPLAGFALAFYPSDTERWIFVMPAVALFLAPCACARGWAVVAVVLLANLFVGQLPAAMDHGPVERAAAVEAAVPPRALIISPGHGWDELIGLGTTKPVRRFPLVYFVGTERSLQRAVARMHAEIARTRAGGDAAFVARLRDEVDRQGFKELRWFGLSPDAFAALFAPYAPRPTRVPGLWALSPRGDEP